MDCPAVRDLLGPFLDDELPATQRGAVETHLAACRQCAEVLTALKSVTSRLAEPGSITVPEALWPAIAERLDGASPADRVAPTEHQPPAPASHSRFFRRPWVTAAGIALAVGLGLLGALRLGGSAAPAQAATIDFGILLDALPLDAKKAFRKFLIQYDARETTAHRARTSAPHLDFAIPETLPGGFRLEQVYTLRFGTRPGVAATYTRGDEFLGTIFHKPVRREDYGSHRDYPCVVGRHRGHKVVVGQWMLVHLTDETTCHCVLSRLDEHEELPAVLTAIVPGTGSPNAADLQ
ncbi:MAG: zf-HC2 domain-containing protein [Planctomycetes bacterium]|nr:zf-HC2 domain-containing protein [Planctomycetota bacterium]